MGLIKKANELNIQGKIKGLIYGQAGMGKTTLALSTPKPLLFDFDNGVHRVNYNHLQGVDTVQINSYQNFIDVLANEDLTPYETIVIDTGGKMLDYMGDYIIKSSPKMGRADGMLTLQGYGKRKGMFTQVINKIGLMNKHILFLAHRETVKEQDEMRYVPLFGGSSYDSLVTELDLVGYLEANGKNRTITFNPTSRNDGKNTCNLPAVMPVPVIIDADGEPIHENDFLTKKVIEPYYNRLKERTINGEKYNQIITDLEINIDLITDKDTLNDCKDRIISWDHVGNSKIVSAKKLNDKSKELGLIFNKELNLYEISDKNKNKVKLDYLTSKDYEEALMLTDLVILTKYLTLKELSKEHKEGITNRIQQLKKTA